MIRLRLPLSHLGKHWLVPGLLLVLGATPGLRAQPALPPEVQERLQRLEGLVEDLLASQAALQKNLAGLRDELQAVREENRRVGDRLGERFASAEDLRKLAEALREVDRKREEDKRLILEEIKKLAQAPAPPPARETARSASREKPTAPPVPQKGYTYKIKPGDTLSAIAQAYTQSGVKVSVDDILRANPDLKPNRLPVDREIFIPDPNLK
jgi:LysM repeat protein/outer membrane murein-binding lipoprotein Lpp